MSVTHLCKLDQCPMSIFSKHIPLQGRPPLSRPLPLTCCHSLGSCHGWRCGGLKSMGSRTGQVTLLPICSCPSRGMLSSSLSRDLFGLSCACQGLGAPRRVASRTRSRSGTPARTSKQPCLVCDPGGGVWVAEDVDWKRPGLVLCKLANSPREPTWPSDEHLIP